MVGDAVVRVKRAVALSTDIPRIYHGVADFAALYRVINSYAGGVRLDGLATAVATHPTPAISTGFFTTLLPFMVQCVKSFDWHFPGGVPLLWQAGAVVLTRRQVLTLVAGMFLCVFDPSSDPDGGMYNDCSFGIVLGATHDSDIAKMQCFLQYFETMRLATRRETAAPPAAPAPTAPPAIGVSTPALPAGMLELDACIIFRRLELRHWSQMDSGNLSHPPAIPSGTSAAAAVLAADTAAYGYFTSCARPLLPMKVEDVGGIDDAIGSLKADFANEYIGGGTLSGASVRCRSGGGRNTTRISSSPSYRRWRCARGDHVRRRTRAGRIHAAGTQDGGE